MQEKQNKTLMCCITGERLALLGLLGNTVSVTLGDTPVARRGATEHLVGILKVKTTRNTLSNQVARQNLIFRKS